MDYSLIIDEILGLWWLLLVLLALTALRMSWIKGLVGEVVVKLMTSVSLPSSTYHRLHNVTLPTPDGTTQIDHILVSRFGIFVVETKNMKGWIFGGEQQAQWTQKIFKQSFKFQNPLRQNYKHVKAIEAALGIAPELIYSVVVFVGDSRFKTPMPDNVTYGFGYIRYIKSFRELVLSEDELQELLSRLKENRLRPSWQTHRQHVEQLKTRSDATAVRKCPRCGEPMVLRTASRGANVGSRFWGCSAYPKCRATQTQG